MTMALSDRKIYLASRSPRRRELLRQIGVGHEVLLMREDARRGAEVDETPMAGEAPRDYALRVAIAKAQAGLQVVARRATGMIKPVLAADTTIALDNTIIGKPADAADAKRILHALSGRSHVVITAVAVAFADQLETRISESIVSMAALSDALILLAGRMSIPGEQYEAASVDGASNWQKFRFITWPSMRSLYLTSTILSMIWTLGDFNSVYLLTGGGPADLTHVLATLGIRYLRLDQVDLSLASIVVALPLVLPLVYFMMKRLSK